MEDRQTERRMEDRQEGKERKEGRNKERKKKMLMMVSFLPTSHTKFLQHRYPYIFITGVSYTVRIGFYIWQMIKIYVLNL